MKETFEQYVDRILSYAGKDPGGHRARIGRTPDAITRRVAGVPRRRLTKRPKPGKWSARDILAHLADVEVLWGFRMRLVLGQNRVPLIGMDQDVWAKRYGRVDPRRALATFVALRRANLELLDGLRASDYRRWGQHSQFGRLTIARMVALLAGHDINHSRQIEAILNGSKGKKGKSRRAR
jgi:uncharacterized damage-inducible protein DinB